jgi:hypothetical protein
MSGACQLRYDSTKGWRSRSDSPYKNEIGLSVLTEARLVISLNTRKRRRREIGIRLGDSENGIVQLFCHVT